MHLQAINRYPQTASWKSLSSSFLPLDCELFQDAAVIACEPSYSFLEPIFSVGTHASAVDGGFLVTGMRFQEEDGQERIYNY